MPAKPRVSVISRRLAWVGLLLAGTILSAPIAPASDRDPLRTAFTAAGNQFPFDTGVLRGTLHEGGRSLGLRPVTEISSGKALAGMYGLLSPYRLLTADARFGTAAWEWASQARLLSNGAVEVQWTADPEHPLDMTAVYRFAAPGVLDFTATVKPRQELHGFELFLASYFDGFPTAEVYVRDDHAPDGKSAFLEAAKAAGVWQAFPRDDAAVKLFGDGRWKRPPHPVSWAIRSRLASPLALRRDANSGLTAVLMAPAEDCFAVSMPWDGDNHRSVYLSLFGRDLVAGRTATARARLVIGRAISDQQAIALYGDYLQGLR
jgi:hypothetical protein